MPECWIIDVDHVADADKPKGTNANAVGVMGPGGCKLEPADPRLCHRFRIYDDDGELYYEGRCTEADVFAPLDDFGQPNAGATEIRYLHDGDWRQL